MYLSLTKFFVYIVIFLGFLSNFNVYALSKNKLYSETSISNYFSGLISSNNNNNELAFTVRKSLAVKLPYLLKYKFRSIDLIGINLLSTFLR